MRSRLVRLAVPIMASNLLQMMYNLVDAWYLGRLGPAAVSAPSIAFSLVFMISVFGMGFSMAGTTLVSQAYGANDHRRVDYAAGQTAIFVVFIGIVVSALGVVLVRPAVALLNVPVDAIAYTRSYMIIVFAGMPLMFVFFVLQAVLQGVGNSVTPLLVQLATVLLNIVLDPILIYGLGPVPRLEVAGAATATVISRGVGAILAVIILVRGGRGVRLRRVDLAPNGATVRELLEIGLPTSLGMGLTSLGFTVLQGVVNTFGVAVVAAFGVANRIIGLFNMPAIGLSRATASLVGQELGGERPDGARAVVRAGLGTMLIFIVPSMTLTYLYGNSFVRFFVNDPEVIRHGATLFRIVSVSVVPFTLLNVIQGVFQGSGHTRPMMAVGIFRLWGLRVPLAILLSGIGGLGPNGIWFAMFISNILAAAVAFVLLGRGRWLQPRARSETSAR